MSRGLGGLAVGWLLLGACAWLDEGLEAAEPAVRITIPEACLRVGQQAYHKNMVLEIPRLLTTISSSLLFWFKSSPDGDECWILVNDLVLSATSPTGEAVLVIPHRVLEAVQLWDTPRLVALAQPLVRQLWRGDCTDPVRLTDTLTVVLVRPHAGGACAP